jgi:hypothetical protein
MSRRNTRNRGADPRPGDSRSDEYKHAIDDTRGTLAQRTSRYRLLVFAVLITIFGSLVTAAATRAWRPLAVSAALFPVCATFFWLDARTVTEWRRRLLIAWANGELMLPAVVETLSKIPGLPPTTLIAMLATLPSGATLGIAGQLDHRARLHLARALDVLHNESVSQLLVTAIASAIVVAAMVSAVLVRSRGPIFALALLPIIAALRVLDGRRRTRALADEIQRTPLDSRQADALAHALQSLHYAGSAASLRAALIAALRSAARNAER